MKIIVAGTRGIPDIPGGVEKHCQELYPRLARLGHHVTVVSRTPYVADSREDWSGVRLWPVYAPHTKSFEAIVHTFLAVLKARFRAPDVLHIHGIGPALLVPFARLLGMTVVFTSHGPDYERQKWGRAARAMLRLGEYMGGKYANEVIVISRGIGDILRRRCGREANLVFNGVPQAPTGFGEGELLSRGIRPGQYVLALARFVPEKGLHHLVNAFKRLDGDLQLVVAGDADHESEYSRKLKESASSDKKTILTGYITGTVLQQVLAHARLFVLPSYHEGLPIALLEAMSYGVPPLVSDIPANREVDLPDERFFRCGDEDDLLSKMKLLLEKSFSADEKAAMQRMVAEKYNWDRIAEQTVEVYRKALAR